MRQSERLRIEQPGLLSGRLAGLLAANGEDGHPSRVELRYDLTPKTAGKRSVADPLRIRTGGRRSNATKRRRR